MDDIRAWWAEREPRERVLLGVLAALAALFVTVFALVLPVLDARDASQRALAKAQADYRIVARAASSGPATQKAGRTAFDRSVLLSLAQAQGLKITRIQPGPDGGLAVWIDDAPAPALYGLFAQLLGETSATMERVSVSADASGRLSSQFTLR